ncbi:HEAT repeat domain-containing protein [Candidatus Peregrinibacteria bacterium]|nr:HEAT repeat domain-containing protein [Candidatus Peregrinibacteria bacterium]
METDTESTVEVIFKLSNEKDERLIAFSDDVLTAKQSNQRFPNAAADYLGRLNPEIFNAVAARTKSIQWVEAIFISKDLDSVQSERLVNFIVRSSLIETEKFKILFRLFKSSSPYLAIQSFEGLRLLRYPYLEDALEEAYKISPFESVRMMAAEIIVKTKPQRKSELFAPFVNSEDENVRRKAYITLGEDTFVRLSASLDNLDEETQRKAAQALAKLDPSIGERLSKEIDSLDPQKRIKALRIAGLAGGNLIKMATELINDPDVKVRATAVKALGAAPTGEGLRLLINLIKDPDRRIRGNAVESIEDIGDKRLAPLLKNLANDPDNRVRGNAIKALWVLGEKDIAGDVETMLKNEDENMRLSGIWVAGETNYQGAKDALVNILTHEQSPKVKEKILETLKEKIT